MAENIINDWLEEFESLADGEMQSYCNNQEHNLDVIMAVHEILTNPYKFKVDNIVDRICSQLLAYYRSGEEQLKRFTLQFAPALIFLHLTDKTFTAVHTLIVSLYNMETVDAKGQPRTIAFRIPSIAQSSIYHDSSTLEATFTAISSLKRWEECNTKRTMWGPWPQIEHLTVQNRPQVSSVLVFLYNQQLAAVQPQTIEYTCKGISRLVTQGFSGGGGGCSARSSVASDSSYNQCQQQGRIPVSSQLLIELLHTVLYAIEKGVPGSMHALNDVAQRAHYETFFDVQLLANAIESLLQHPSSAPRPVMQSQRVSKSMITNASFRTKKLPDDIPIQEVSGGDAAQLDAISEEGAPSPADTKGSRLSRASVTAIKQHLPKHLPGLGKRHKLKQQQSDATLEQPSLATAQTVVTTTATTTTTTTTTSTTTQSVDTPVDVDLKANLMEPNLVANHNHHHHHPHHNSTSAVM